MVAVVVAVGMGVVALDTLGDTPRDDLQRGTGFCLLIIGEAAPGLFRGDVDDAVLSERGRLGVVCLLLDRTCC